MWLDDIYGRRAKSKSCVFRCFLKVATEMAEQTDSGRLFQRDGAQEWKALAPVLVFTLGTDNYYCCLILVNGKELMWQAWSEDKQAVSVVCSSCFYHMRDQQRICRHLDLDSAKLLVTALVSSCLNYCNSLLYGIADIDLTRLHACTESTGPPGDKVSSIYLQYSTALFSSLVASKV